MKDPYKILGISPGASEKEIRDAYQKLKKIFRSDNPTIYSIYDDEEIKLILAEIEEAVSLLLNQKRSKEEEKPVNKTELTEITEDVAPPLMDVDFSSVPVSGEFFKMVRKKKGYTLKDVASVTKIQRSFLQAIEEENFSELPARVFTRGFVVSYAKFLKLDDVDRIVKEYMKKFDEAKGENK